MDNKTNKLLEAILLAIQDQHKTIIKVDGRLVNVENGLTNVGNRLISVENAVKESTREISKLSAIVERHDKEIEKVIEVHGEDIMILKDKVTKLEKK
ncbi:MAG: hypothetical protein PHP42_13865 [Bacteroidota bacterium]|nr:hypothetical protein [Bacteroidota bacterium]